jgi:hypothetical protein
LAIQLENRNKELIGFQRRSDLFADGSYDVALDEFSKESWATKEREPRGYRVGARDTLRQHDGEMEKVEDEIRSSRFILGLQNDFEEDHFEAYSETTWKRATNFFRRMAIHAISCRFFDVKLPTIGPAARGSIDIFWELSDRTLLINVPAGDGPATYYGMKLGSEISGRIDPNLARPELILWLADTN